jgi:hypothetical protein
MEGSRKAGQGQNGNEYDERAPFQTSELGLDGSKLNVLFPRLTIRLGVALKGPAAAGALVLTLGQRAGGSPAPVGDGRGAAAGAAGDVEQFVE